MGIVGILVGLFLVLVVLWETFETIVLPRTVIRNVRLTRLYYVTAWRVYSAGAPGDRRSTLRESYLSTFGPLSLLGLIMLWVFTLILGFALIQWGMGSHVVSSTAHSSFETDLYVSGTTFFTLGLGDVVPATPSAKIGIVCEAEVGFGFLAVVIGYLPVIYSSFSRREVGISLLDARAGSPPTAGEMLLRHARGDSLDTLTPLMATFEAWTSDLMESHLSYPVVAYYRSQHDRESWLSTVAAILDTCALIEVGFEQPGPWYKSLQWQARMTFAMARHAIVDLSLVFNAAPIPEARDRLSPEEFARLHAALAAGGFVLPPDAEARLAALRRQYEPYLRGLSGSLLMSLPPWLPASATLDNWQSSAWRDESHL